MKEIQLNILFSLAGLLVAYFIYEDMKNSEKLSIYTSIRGWGAIIIGILYAIISILRLIYNISYL